MLQLFIALFMLAAATCAHANDVPELVQRFLDSARASCIKAGGTPEPKPEISGLDLNGDGHTDWFVHYKGYCIDAPNQFCVEGECTFELFIGRAEGGPRLFVNQGTITWRTDRLLGKPALILHRRSEFCPRRGQRICDDRFVFERNGAFRHLPYR